MFIITHAVLSIMLFIGMKTNFMIYPTTPITANPIAQELAILVNSF